MAMAQLRRQKTHLSGGVGRDHPQDVALRVRRGVNRAKVTEANVR